MTLCTKISPLGFTPAFLTPFKFSSPDELLQNLLTIPNLFRNVLVFPGHRVKISQCGMARPLYASDYSPLGPGGKLVPLRWMAWESLLLVSLKLTSSDRNKLSDALYLKACASQVDGMGVPSPRQYQLSPQIHPNVSTL